MSNRRVMICLVLIFDFDRKEWTESALLVSLHVFRLNGTFDKNAVMSSGLHRETEKRGEVGPTSDISRICCKISMPLHYRII